MGYDGDVLLSWDKTADVLYVVRKGYDLDALINENSERAPGFVKRIDPVSRECVGFMIHTFSERFPMYAGCPDDQLKLLMDVSLGLTNEKAFTGVAKAA